MTPHQFTAQELADLGLFTDDRPRRGGAPIVTRAGATILRRVSCPRGGYDRAVFETFEILFRLPDQHEREGFLVSLWVRHWASGHEVLAAPKTTRMCFETRATEGWWPVGEATR